MSLNSGLALVAGLVTAVLAVSVLLKFRQRHSPHHLFWGVGLALFAVGSLSEGYIQTASFSPWTLGAWYVAGAMLTAAWIGQGSLLLLNRHSEVRLATAVFVLAATVAAVVAYTLVTPQAGHFVPNRPPSTWYRSVLLEGAASRPLLILTILLNSYGTVLAVGAAAYSAWTFWRRRQFIHRAQGNVLILAGFLVISAAGTLTRFGNGSFLPVGELLAALLLYAGFTLAGRPATAIQPAASPSPAPNQGQTVSE